MGMLNPMNREQAKKDCILLSEKAYGKEKVALFEETYKLERDPENSFQWYTRESFFYQILNKGLRVLKSPAQSFYLRLIFSDAFLSIWESYQE